MEMTHIRMTRFSLPVNKPYLFSRLWVILNVYSFVRWTVDPRTLTLVAPMDRIYYVWYEFSKYINFSVKVIMTS